MVLFYLDKSWKNNSPITTYQFNNHNSSQTIQQPSATGNNSRNLNHLFNSFEKDVERGWGMEAVVFICIAV